MTDESEPEGETLILNGISVRFFLNGTLSAVMHNVTGVLTPKGELDLEVGNGIAEKHFDEVDISSYLHWYQRVGRFLRRMVGGR